MCYYNFSGLCVLLIFSGCIFSACTSNDAGNKPVSAGRSIGIWQTRGDKSKLLAKPEGIEFNKSDTAGIIIKIDTAQQLQTIDGFGAALTGSSAYVLNRHLKPAARTALLKELFTKDGIGIDYIRLTIGASDFSLRDFSYDDTPGDTLINNFSLDVEKADLLPVLKEIIAIHPSIKIMASPWSPPAWMKTNNSMKGGHLETKYYRAYARYFVKYIQAMKKEGIVIDAITIQNEPLYGSATYPCMFMFAPEQRDFIRYHLGPLFRENSINTKIILYDHNWDRPLYGDTVLKEPAAAQYVDGTAFHAYGGDVSAMGQLRNLHPGKNVYFTEISGGGWASDWGDNLDWFTDNVIIGTTRHGSKNALLWNLALDENDGPKNNGCPNCRGVVTVSTAGVVTRNEEYYILGHAGKCIQQGAKFCESDDLSAHGIKNAAYINPDGSKVFLVLNKDTSYKKIIVNIGAHSFNYSLDPRSVYTFYWK
jgi:glucosylceramidase